MELQQYEFEIKHRPGKLNSNADALSRRPTQETEISDEDPVENFCLKTGQIPNDYQPLNSLKVIRI